MPLHRAVCEDCSWDTSGEDLEAVADAMEDHTRKEVGHDVDLQRAVATDGGRDDVKTVTSYGDLAADGSIDVRDVDAIAELLGEHGHKDDWLIAWVPAWILEEKDLDPAPASKQVVHGRIEHETAKAYCVAAGRDDIWIPKSVIRVYERGTDAEIKIPRRGLSDFEGGEA